MTEEELLKKAKDFFAASRFEVKKEKITGVIVPGSVGILGEANELNRGKVLSGNLDKSAVLMAQKRRENDRSVNLYSKKFDEGIRVLLNDAQSKHDNGWANYISSTFFMLESMSKKVPGMNLYIDNDIPDSFQSNHMEALETGAAVIAGKLSDWQMSALEIAEICAQGEVKYMGREKNTVKFIPSIGGRPGHLTYFDIKAGSVQALPFGIKGHLFMVLSSGVKKKTIEAKRAQIMADVAESIDIMKRNGAQLDTLDEITLEKFDDYRSKLSITQRKRCAYFISENERVDEAKKAIMSGKSEALIDIMNESNKNMKARLEIVEEESEILLDMLGDTDGVKAARVMNLGTDGSILAIVDAEKRKAFESRLKKSFLGRTGLPLTIETFALTNEMRAFDVPESVFIK
ncbi:MAG: Galactokinase [Candidatus Aerophobetes bacterium ADurb.Bin490]|nr:MAG: Galactokinase [Candidatus Aerophobetes bacterium ADurb.Bin490]HPI02882.1 hypothetical protein [Candidatus Goldiibacteriota bacterium]HPN64329.1 hypothetical protein [Candidatus Goldiibacteriota bacterium]HRQ43321.1 hypothetical protein [Candidatus Goldiibacteriota bacterium]